MAAQKALETVERQTRALGRLIEDLLDVSRIITGKLRLDVAPVAMEPVVNAAVESVALAAAARRIRIQKNLPATLPNIAGDSGRLQQVLWNLLANAVKFTHDGGLVELIVESTGGEVVIAVRDTGRGITPGFMPYVFDRFRQAANPMTRAQGGLGLGLSIVRQLVELHGGTVAAESPGEGLGATFTARIPIAIEARAALGPERPEAPPAEEEPLLGVRVLLVEDDADAREYVAAALALSGALVATAASAEGALLSLGGQPIDVLVSDIAMPGEDGYSMIRRIRALTTASAAVPALALTAHARPEDCRQALLAGFQAHLGKPTSLEELTKAVAHLAGRPANATG
ncbi:MAG: response regulator [Myxococcales bacterium]|nr:response regulator [Myxococcales bacterium]